MRFIIVTCQANVNAATFDGSTPLKLAVGRGFHAVANFLVQAGADRSLLSSDDSDSSESDDDIADDEVCCFSHTLLSETFPVDLFSTGHNSGKYCLLD